MGPTFNKRAIAEFLNSVRAAHQMLANIESAIACPILDMNNQLKDDLSAQLGDLGRRLPILLDLIGMTDTRRDFHSSWASVVDNLDSTYCDADDYGPVVKSKALQIIDDVVEVLEGGLIGKDEIKIAILEYILESTAQIVKSYGVTPKGELEIQGPMHYHLEYTFSDYSNNITLPKGLKSFKPDGGIPSLEALIEFKFVTSKEDTKLAESGIMEDLSGYGGSRDWTRYYTVIYQTKPLVTKTRFQDSLRLSGNAGGWRFIVVSGEDAEKAHRAKPQEMP